MRQVHFSDKAQASHFLNLTGQEIIKKKISQSVRPMVINVENAVRERLLNYFSGLFCGSEINPP